MLEALRELDELAGGAGARTEAAALSIYRCWSRCANSTEAAALSIYRCWRRCANSTEASTEAAALSL